MKSFHPNEINLKSLNEYDFLALQMEAEKIGKNAVAALREQMTRQGVEIN